MKSKDEIINGIVARFKSEVIHVYDSGYANGYACGCIDGENARSRRDEQEEINRRIDDGELHCTYCEYWYKDEDEEPCLGCMYNAVPKFVPSVEQLEKRIAEEKKFNG